MSDLSNIHDKFVRATFENVDRARALFESTLSSELLQVLDLDSIRVLKESYIQDDLTEYFSDLVFELDLKESKTNTTDVVLLFEHKSSPDKNVLFQLGHYMFSHWFKKIRNSEPIKPIIPIIYYQGRQRWIVPSLKEIFGEVDEIVQAYIPDIHYEFIGLHSLSERTIEKMRDGLVGVAMMAQKWRSNPVRMKQDLERIFKLFPLSHGDRNFFQMVAVYIIRVTEVSAVELMSTVTDIPGPVKADIMSTYDLLIEEGIKRGKQEGIQLGKQEGIQLGKQEGIQLGKQEGIKLGKQEGIKLGEQEGQYAARVELVRNAYDMGMDFETISKLTSLTKEEIQRILDQLPK